jgi:hypothetical protein
MPYLVHEVPAGHSNTRSKEVPKVATPVSVRIGDDLLKRVKEYAYAEERSASAVIRRALRTYIASGPPGSNSNIAAHNTLSCNPTVVPSER